MFDSVVAQADAPRFVGRGAALSLALHGLALTVAVVLSTRTAARLRTSDAPTVTFVAAAPPPPPPPPPPAGGSSTPKPTSHPKVARKQPVVVPKEAPPDPEPREEEQEPSTTPDVPGVAGGVPGGVVGGVPGGVVGGVVGGVLGGTGTAPVGGGGTGVLPFGEGMTRPTLLSGSDPTYTREALAARVEGTMIVKCVITTSGTLDDCRVVKGLSFMNDAVLTALRGRRYTPVLYQGRPTAVNYVFNLKLVLP